jgi:toxin ParE1/3/4
MLKYKLHRDAQLDISEVIQYYENERPGLGSDFFNEFQATLNLIRRHPKIGAVKEENIRKFSLDRYIYDIFYYIKNDTICVAGILHQHRDPDLIQSRIKDIL